MRLDEIYSGKITIEEKTKENNFVKIFAPFLEADVENGNGRIYPLAIVKDAIDRARIQIAKHGTLLGAADHPTGAKNVELDKVSHLVTDVSLREKTAYFKSKILDTTSGTNLQKILKGGGKIGISLRGIGDTERRENIDYVKNLTLCSIDFVSNPSFPFFADETMIYESQFLVDEAITEQRYYFAIRAGYRGTLADYRKIFFSRDKNAKR
jgi:hypothetical protein